MMQAPGKVSDLAERTPGAIDTSPTPKKARPEPAAIFSTTKVIRKPREALLAVEEH
jgi:hypothetical protein